MARHIFGQTVGNIEYIQPFGGVTMQETGGMLAVEVEFFGKIDYAVGTFEKSVERIEILKPDAVAKSFVIYRFPREKHSPGIVQDAFLI